MRTSSFFWSLITRTYTDAVVIMNRWSSSSNPSCPSDGLKFVYVIFKSMFSHYFIIFVTYSMDILRRSVMPTQDVRVRLTNVFLSNCCSNFGTHVLYGLLSIFPRTRQKTVCNNNSEPHIEIALSSTRT